MSTWHTTGRLAALTATFVLGSLPIASAQAQSAYAVTELKAFLSGDLASGRALSNSGAVVGLSNVLTGYKFTYGGIVATYQQSGVIWPYVTSASQYPTRIRTDFTPVAINASGLIAGYSGASPKGLVLVEQGKYLLLEGSGTVYGGGVHGLNANGWSVGSIQTPGYPLPTLWRRQSRQTLELVSGALGGTGSGINDAGQMVGNLDLPDYRSVPVLWNTVGQLQWVGDVGHRAVAVNNAGQVLLELGSNAGYALRDASGTVVRLLDDTGAPMLAVSALNGKGDVLGRSANGRTIIRKQDGAFIDLVQLEAAGKLTLPSNLKLWGCSHLNDSGMLLCSAAGPKQRQFRLRPL